MLVVAAEPPAPSCRTRRRIAEETNDDEADGFCSFHKPKFGTKIRYSSAGLTKLLPSLGLVTVKALFHRIDEAQTAIRLSSSLGERPYTARYNCVTRVCGFVASRRLASACGALGQ